MLANKSQISVEYLILTGFLLLAIIIPAVIFLYSLANQSVYGTVNAQKAVDIGNGFVTNAKQLYYLGLYSKRIVEYDVPQSVWKVFVVEINEGDKLHYYVGIILNDTKQGSKFFFQSNVPLIAEAPPGHPDLVNTQDNSEAIPECRSPNSCNFYNFAGSVIKPGRKEFKIETKIDTAAGGSEAKVYIIPLID
jgi:uncharacterized protein (UPF0333 family)